MPRQELHKFMDTLWQLEKDHAKLFEKAKSTRYGPAVDSIQSAVARLQEKCIELDGKMSTDRNLDSPEQDEETRQESSNDYFVHRKRR